MLVFDKGLQPLVCRGCAYIYEVVFLQCLFLLSYFQLYFVEVL